MDSPAQRKLAQIICSTCTAKRFFVYAVEGDVEIICAGCGARGSSASVPGKQIAARP